MNSRDFGFNTNRSHATAEGFEELSVSKFPHA
jgi:hypothetical protein